MAKKVKKAVKPRKSKKAAKISLGGIVAAIEVVEKQIDAAVKHAPQEIGADLESKKGQLQEIKALVGPICKHWSLTIFPR